jgi:hypothetical protein
MDRSDDHGRAATAVSPSGLALAAFGAAVVLLITAAVLGGLGIGGTVGPDAPTGDPATPTGTSNPGAQSDPAGEDGPGAGDPATATPSDEDADTATPGDGGETAGATATPTGTPDSDVEPTDEGSDGDEGSDRGEESRDGSDGRESGGGGSGADTGSNSGSDPVDGSDDGTDEGAAHFVIRVQEVEECGQRCRDVTAAVENDGTATAENVTVDARVLAAGDELWRGAADVGTLPAGETATRTERVTIGVFDAAKIQANGGYVTIELTVRWDGGEDTVTERRHVA